jgi:hypothetical protein
MKQAAVPECWIRVAPRPKDVSELLLREMKQS